MKIKKLLATLFLTIALVMTSINVYGDEPVGMDIRDRLSNPTRNIIDTFNIVFKDDDNIITEPTIEDHVTIDLSWSLENSESILIEEGDYFTFQLPNIFKIDAVLSGTLGTFGSFTIDPSGEVTFVFNDQISAHSVVHGFLNFTASLDEQVIENPGQHEVILPIEENSTFNFHLHPTKKDTGIDKKGVADKERNPDYITWEVKINKFYEILNDVVVTDTIPAGLTIEEIRVLPLNLKHDGTFGSYGPALTAAEYTVNGGEVSFHNEINQPYSIFYKTKINEAIKPDTGGEIKFINNAKMTSEENGEITATSSYIAKYGKLIEKINYQYDAEEQSFIWAIKYNFGEKIQTNPLLTDVFDSDLEYVAGSFAIYHEDETTIITDDFDFTLTNSPANQLNIQFNQDVTGAIILVYKTKVKEGVLIVEETEFENEISTGSNSNGSSGTATPQLVIKSSPKINYSTKKISWSITVNLNEYQLNNYKLTDTYVYRGLTLDEASFKIIDASADPIVTVHPNNYDLVITSDVNGETGFVVTFKNDYVQTNSKLIVTFDTDYDYNNILGTSEPLFRNRVALKWTDEYGEEHTNKSTANRRVILEVVNNGTKHGSYNAVTKEITWTVAVNYNSEDLVNSELSDKILAGQHFIADSLVIKKYTVNSNGTINQSPDTEDLDDFIIDYPSSSNDETLTISFPNEGQTKYIVEYRTSLENEEINKTYHNKAIFKNGTYVRELPAAVTITHGDKFVSKTGVQNGALINWRIAINQSQSTIIDAQLVDTPTSNQILIEDSFRLYPVIVDPDESYTVDFANPLVRDTDYTLEIDTDYDTGQQTFTLKFLYEINRTYVLFYDSQINASPEDNEISNTVQLSGNGVYYENEEPETEIIIDVNSAGGGAVGVKGTLAIIKFDEDDVAMAGVEFELYNPLNNKVATRVTDDDGLIVFKNLVYGTYTLKETATLAGFVISDELFEGMTIEVGEETSDPEYFVVLRNKMSKLTIYKLNAEEDLLDGSIFKLEVLDEEDEYQIVEDELEVTDGMIVLTGLPAGDYRLTELTAPNGYILNSAPLEFTITLNDNGQVVDYTAEFINYQGSVKLTKVGLNDTLLEGVTFDLYNEDDELIYEDLVTDTEGEILLENILEPGNYYFVETGSVDGYIINETPLTFSIVDTASDEPALVEVTATNFKGSVEFKKVDLLGNPLEGVEFELILVVDDETDEYLATVLSNNSGIVRVDHLAPGNYYFKEVTTLEGYILNTALIPFEIPEIVTAESVLIELADFVNYQGRLTLKKLDSKGKLLKGAVFEVEDEEENKTTLTTVDGIANLAGLVPGAYNITEIKAPNGYVKTEEVFSFIVPESFEGEVEEIVIEVLNLKKLPGTGMESFSSSLPFFLIGFGILVFLWGKKKKRVS